MDVYLVGLQDIIRHKQDFNKKVSLSVISRGCVGRQQKKAHYNRK